MLQLYYWIISCFTFKSLDMNMTCAAQLYKNIMFNVLSRGQRYDTYLELRSLIRLSFPSKNSMFVIKAIKLSLDTQRDYRKL